MDGLGANASTLESVALTAGDPSFELTFGPLLIGVILNALLLGVFMVQVHSYFHLYQTDYRLIRCLIYYLIVIEIANTVCNILLIYEPLIKMHDSPLVTINAPTLLPAGALMPPSVLSVLTVPSLRPTDPIVTGLISTPVQLFMAWRIRLVTKSTWLAVLVALLAFTSLVGATISTVFMHLHPRFDEFTDFEAPLAVWLTSTAFADLFITAFLVNFLWVNKTGFKTRTDSVADKIIFFTVQTGTLTSFAAIADVTLFLVLQRTTLMFIWDFSLSKLYAICLIATLNARNEWNNLLSSPVPPTDDKSNPPRKGSAASEEIIKIRRATDVQNLQLYIPSQFETSSQTPRRRTPTSRMPLALWRSATGRSTRDGTRSTRETRTRAGSEDVVLVSLPSLENSHAGPSYSTSRAEEEDLAVGADPLARQPASYGGNQALAVPGHRSKDERSRDRSRDRERARERAREKAAATLAQKQSESAKRTAEWARSTGR
ncbi:hypothetical protein MKEN_01003800 [Mycena kentingensis (nom. inval.)]|nr:hypothetical protein MKEN_01003800 [Mycena kentingensis (nom. inval.)]